MSVEAVSPIHRTPFRPRVVLGRLHSVKNMQTRQTRPEYAQQSLRHAREAIAYPGSDVNYCAQGSGLRQCCCNRVYLRYSPPTGSPIVTYSHALCSTSFLNERPQKFSPGNTSVFPARGTTFLHGWFSVGGRDGNRGAKREFDLWPQHLGQILGWVSGEMPQLSPSQSV